MSGILSPVFSDSGFFPYEFNKDEIDQFPCMVSDLEKTKEDLSNYYESSPLYAYHLAAFKVKAQALKTFGQIVIDQLQTRKGFNNRIISDLSRHLDIRSALVLDLKVASDEILKQFKVIEMAHKSGRYSKNIINRNIDLNTMMSVFCVRFSELCLNLNYKDIQSIRLLQKDSQVADSYIETINQGLSADVLRFADSV